MRKFVLLLIGIGILTVAVGCIGDQARQMERLKAIGAPPPSSQWIFD